MTQPVSLRNIPVFHPFKCIRCKCGVGANGRIYFIDLGISFSEEFNPLHDGNVYYCNLCAANLVEDINNVVGKWNEEHAPWDSPDRVASTYKWEKDIDLSGIERTFSREAVTSSEPDDRELDTDELAAELDDSAFEGTDELPESTIPTDVSNDERSSLDVSRGIGLDFGT